MTELTTIRTQRSSVIILGENIMNTQYQTIVDDELDDMKKEIVKHGHDVNDYKIYESDVKTIQQDNDSYPKVGKITIKRGAVVMTYPSGYLSSWPGQFAIDLANGIFD